MEAVTIKALELWSHHGKKIKVKVLKMLEKFKSPQYFYFKPDVGILHSIVGQSRVWLFVSTTQQNVHVHRKLGHDSSLPGHSNLFLPAYVEFQGRLEGIMI